MESRKVSVPGTGIKNLSQEFYTSDFLLLINDIGISINRVFLDFFSPLISSLHKTDPTANNFSTKLSCSINESDISLIKELLYSGQADIPLSRLNMVIELSELLENIAFVDELINRVTFDESTIISRIIIDMKHKRSVESSVSFAAKHFMNLKDKELKEAPLDVVSLIISSKQLVMDSEHDLFRFIIDGIQHREEFTSLLSHIEYSYLSADDMNEVADYINMDVIDSALLSSLFKRLILDVKKAPKQKNDFPYSVSPFSGIFAHLTKQFGGNVIDKGVVEAMSSTIRDGDLSSLVDSSQKNHIRLDSNKGTIVFDFLTRKIRPTNYTLAVPEKGTVWWGGRPLEWFIEGSNDGISYDTIDHQNCENLDDWGRKETFRIQSKLNKFYRYIRIRGEKTNYNNNRLLLSAVEFFGDLGD